MPKQASLAYCCDSCSLWFALSEPAHSGRIQGECPRCFVPYTFHIQAGIAPVLQRAAGREADFRLPYAAERSIRDRIDRALEGERVREGDPAREDRPLAWPPRGSSGPN